MSVSNGDFLDNSPDVGTTPMSEMMADGDERERQRIKEEKEDSVVVPPEENDEIKRVINYLYMGKVLWDWAKDRANDKGMKLEHFLVTLISDARRGWIDTEEIDNPERYALWARERATVIAEAYEDTYAIAVSCKSHPTDENVQLLYRACEKLGLDPGEVMERAKEDKWADLVVKYRDDPDSKMSRCVKWVIEFCRDREDILSEDFNFAGTQTGYTRQMLSTARKKVGIDSVLRGGKYYLSMPVGRKVLHGRVRE